LSAGCGSSGTQSRPAQFDVSIEPFFLVATLIVGISRAILVAIADALLFGRYVVRTPTVLVLHDCERITLFALI